MRRSKIFFDKRDWEILNLVNHFFESSQTLSGNQLFNPNLHPHGIKELLSTPTARMAYAVINLLRNLEAGSSRAKERLLALQSLYDEVLNSAHSALRRNTARILMQIMKSMVRAHGNTTKQLMLAHDFHAAALGTPRVVRRLLAQYHLPEMPEDWNQLAFDDHVYDVNTQGRKTPTHLIMDAWIKGLKTLTIVYDNCMEIEAADEIIQAANIMGVTIRLGLRLQIPFYGRFIDLLWVPRGFSNGQDLIEFLQGQNLEVLREKGREVLEWRLQMALLLLQTWDRTQRPLLEKQWQVKIPAFEDAGFLQFLGRGHTSKRRIAEYLHQHILPAMRERAQYLHQINDAASLQELEYLEKFTVDNILEEWLSPQKHPELPDFDCPNEEHPIPMPELLKTTPNALVRELVAIPTGYRMTLCVSDLTVEDVAELLWDCEGLITHLEVFNLKSWTSGDREFLRDNLEKIVSFQQALNAGRAYRIKQLVRQMMRRLEASGDRERLNKFQEMLQTLPLLLDSYRHKHLGSRIGGNSSSPLRTHGMGFVLAETVHKRARHFLKESRLGTSIPLQVQLQENISYKEPEYPSLWQKIGKVLRFLPGCKRLGMEKSRSWNIINENYTISEHGDVVTLGGLNTSEGNFLLPSETMVQERPSLRYINSDLKNRLKVICGFIPAFLSFLYSQDFWFLAWFGSFLWFGITGARNALQMVLAAKGVTRKTLTHWKEHVNKGRICDSLFYAGFSVFILEVLVRVCLLQNYFDLNLKDDQLLIFTVINLVNGIYICSHNIYRGFPWSVSIGNFFRSILAIPVTSLYNEIFLWILLLFKVEDPNYYLIASAVIITKLASDTVAAVIEGYADGHSNIRMRRWDYTGKIKSLLDRCTRLEMLLPKEDALLQLARTGGLSKTSNVEVENLERDLIVSALDLMYFWFYQPRAQTVLVTQLKTMPASERAVFAKSQLVLLREREISQFLVDGLLGRNFSRPLAFYLDHRKEYVRSILALCYKVQKRDHRTEVDSEIKM